MGSGIDDGWKAQQRYERSIKNMKEMETLAFKNKEYKNLIDAHVAISELIRQQLKIFVEIRNERKQILKDYWVNEPAASIEELDIELGRGIISPWELKDLIR